nr:MAG TPA: replisome organizer [Caudoviricetes sp.]
MDNKGGFICLWRSLLDNPIWFNSTPEQALIMITLLLMANWKEQKYDIYGKIITLKPGQFITSYSEIAKLTGMGVSVRNVRTGIDRFEKLGFLTREVTRRGSLITIVNWRKYQDINYESDKATDIELTSDRQATDKRLTSDRHAHKRTIQPSNQVTREPSNKNTSPLNPPEGKEGESKKNPSPEWSALIASFAGSNEELAEALREWIAMRSEMAKKRKEVFGIRAAKMALKSLHKLSGGSELKALEIVNQGIEHSWKGFYPLRDGKRDRQNETVRESLERSMQVLDREMEEMPF